MGAEDDINDHFPCFTADIMWWHSRCPQEGLMEGTRTSPHSETRGQMFHDVITSSQHFSASSSSHQTNTFLQAAGGDGVFECSVILWDSPCVWMAGTAAASLVDTDLQTDNRPPSDWSQQPLRTPRTLSSRLEKIVLDLNESQADQEQLGGRTWSNTEICLV